MPHPSEHHPEFTRESGGVLLSDCDGCRWPVRRENRTSFFCDAPKTLGSAYCAEHHRVAYRVVRIAEVRS